MRDNTPAVGTIVLVHFPFTDLTGMKRRPAVVLAHASGDDLILACITSETDSRSSHTIMIPKTSKNFTATGLHTSSLIRVDKMVTLEKRILTGELGTLGTTQMKEVRGCLKRLFSLV